ncbi:MAG: hypothetical protein M3P98_00875 [bacterium]|nr:hypothetical protein [bacterium]
MALKKQSKTKKILSKLDPNTGKKRLVAFIIVFALIGGGFYAYRSFASTSGYKTVVNKDGFRINACKQDLGYGFTDVKVLATVDTVNINQVKLQLVARTAEGGEIEHKEVNNWTSNSKKTSHTLSVQARGIVNGTFWAGFLTWSKSENRYVSHIEYGAGGNIPFSSIPRC